MPVSHLFLPVASSTIVCSLRRTVMRRISVSLVVLAAFCGVGLKADDDTLSFRATLSSFQETPTLSTPGTGTFTATVRNTNAGIQIQYRLSYSNLSGTAVV